MLVAHKIELFVTDKQAEYLKGACGAKRFAYNQLVAIYKDTNKFNKTSYVNLIKELRAKYDWMRDFSTRVVRNTVDDLDKAIKKAWSGEAKKERAKRVAIAITPKDKAKALNYAMPNFKKRGLNDNFSIREKEKFKIENRKLKFEKL